MSQKSNIPKKVWLIIKYNNFDSYRAVPFQSLEKVDEFTSMFVDSQSLFLALSSILSLPLSNSVSLTVSYSKYSDDNGFDVMYNDMTFNINSIKQALCGYFAKNGGNSNEIHSFFEQGIVPNIPNENSFLWYPYNFFSNITYYSHPSLVLVWVRSLPYFSRRKVAFYLFENEILAKQPNADVADKPYQLPNANELVYFRLASFADYFSFADEIVGEESAVPAYSDDILNRYSIILLDCTEYSSIDDLKRACIVLRGGRGRGRPPYP